MFWFFYNLIFTPLYLLLLPRFALRMWTRGGYRSGFGQRFGNYSPELTAKIQSEQRVWIHAVSVGEVNLALRFMAAWREKEPDIHFVLSLTTSTGRAVAAAKLDARDELVYVPVDTPWVISKVVKVIRPRAYVMVEQEFWPNLLRRLRKNQVPIAIINGRISDRSFPRYQKIGFFTTRILPLIDLFCMQSDQDTRRIIALGAPVDRVRTLPSMKYETTAVDELQRSEIAALLAQLDMGSERTLLLGGSVWPGEFELLGRVYQSLRERYPELRLILVPRHFEKANIAEAELQALGLSTIRKRSLDLSSSLPACDVLIADTTGEMMAFYELADLVVVGKSFPPSTGGQNPIEPAALGKPVLVGPNMQNFPGVMDNMLAAGAIVQVASEVALETELARLLAEPKERSILGGQARELVESRHRAVPDTVEQVQRTIQHVTATAVRH